MKINRIQHSATDQKFYETVFDDCRLYLNDWIFENRKHKKLINKNKVMSNEENSINFQIRFERTETKKFIKNLFFVDKYQTSRMQFTNFVFPSANVTTQINQKIKKQNLTDDQSSFEKFDFDDMNSDIDVDNSRSSSIFFFIF